MTELAEVTQQAKMSALTELAEAYDTVSAVGQMVLMNMTS